MKSKVVVLDNGAGSIKVGLSGASDPSFVLPNCSASLDRQYRTLYADETEILVKNKSQLKYTRPFERGYLTDWPTQSDIWNYVFSPKVMNIVPKESQGLVVTEPPFNPVTMQNKMDELVFEQHEFPAYFCATSAEFSSQYYKYQYSSASTCDQVCSLVVDSGYSFTHAVPVFDCHPLTHSIRRVDVGGKFLTNYLKELVSYRAYNMQDETHIMNDVKEKLCFCSQMPNIDFSRNPTSQDVRSRARKLRREYVLPNYRSTMQGYVRPRDTNSESLPHEMEDGNTNDLVNEETNEKQLSSRLKTSDNKTLQGTPQKKNARSNDSTSDQLLILDIERVSVPELIFSPRDVGLQQGGLALAIANAVNHCHFHVRPTLLANILLTGGNVNFPNFTQKLKMELRSLLPVDCDMNITSLAQPQMIPWRGASQWASANTDSNNSVVNTNFSESSVSRAEYLEYGHAYCRWKFNQC